MGCSRQELRRAEVYSWHYLNVSLFGFPRPLGLVGGTVLSASDSGDGSLARLPNGGDTNNANQDWKFTITPTPEAANP